MASLRMRLMVGDLVLKVAAGDDGMIRYFSEGSVRG